MGNPEERLDESHVWAIENAGKIRNMANYKLL